MRPARLIAIFAALVLGGCGSGESKRTQPSKNSVSSTRPTPSTLPFIAARWPDPTLPPLPDRATLYEKITRDVQERVVKAAGKDLNSSVDCRGANFYEAGDYPCTVRFASLTFEVAVKSQGGTAFDPSYVFYEVSPTVLPVTRERAEHDLRYNAGSVVSATCRMKDDVVLVRVDIANALECSVVKDGGKRFSYGGRLSPSGTFYFG